MDRYRRAADGIHPSEKLKERTYLKMLTEQRKKRQGSKKRWWWLALVPAAAAVAVAVALILPKNRVEINTQSIRVIPTEQSVGFVGVDTGFMITAVGGELPDEKAMTKLISITPEADFSLEKRDDGYLLTTAGDFAADSLINLKITSEDGSAKNWVFQTAGDFAVKSVFPRDGAEYVDTSTGVEIAFTRADISAEEFEKAFSISPEVKGSFKKSGTVLAFVPDEELSFNERYTVRLFGSLVNAAGEQLGSDVSFSFTTGYGEGAGTERGRVRNFKDASETFLPEDEPVIKFIKLGSASRLGVSVEVWRYDSADGYKRALTDFAADETAAPGTDGLEQVMTFETDAELTDEYDIGYAVFPDTLDKGWYLARLTADDGQGGSCALFKFIQVSDVSVFGFDTDDNSLFWINSAETGNALENAAITLECGGKTVSGTTNGDGVAYLDNPGADVGTGVLEVAAGSERWISLYSTVKNENEPQEDYYSYVYTDRPIYSSDDTIRYWGIVRPRAGAKLPEKLQIAVGEYMDELIVDEVETGPDGTFSGELSFSGLNGFMYLSVKAEGGTLCERCVDIYEYSKPVYDLDVSLDKSICFSGDELTADITVSFFDGTPAPEIPIEIDFCGSTEQAVTDGQGKATVTLTAYDDSNSWTPVSGEMSVSVVGNADVFSSHYTVCTIVPHDIALYGDLDAESGRLNVYTESISLEGVENSDSLYNDNCAAIRGGAVEKTVYGYLYRIWYTKTAAGKEYDFALKKNVRSYEYDRHEQVVKTYKFQTENGYDYIEGLPELNEEDSYFFELSTKDSQGRDVKYNVWLLDGSMRDRRGHSFSFWNDGEDEYSFADGENVSFTLRDYYAEVVEGRVLSVVAGTEAGSYSIGGPKVTVPFEESLVPNFMLYGAWFDGKHIYSVNPGGAWFDPEKRELTLEISGTEKCRPGEEAELTVSVKTPDGSPAANASGVLMLTDEAVFAIKDDEPDVLMELYRAVYYPNGWKTFASYTDYDSVNMDGGKGAGGGSAGARKNFEDSAGAYPFTTDASGKAVIKAVLPDSVASWRATAVAVAEQGGKLLGGDAKTDVAATCDMFVSQIMPQKLIEGDDLVVTLKCFGDALKDRQHTVDYTCVLKTSHRASLAEPGTDVTLKTSGSADEYVTLEFGKPSAGEYTVTITAECGELRDSVELPLTVEKSAVETPVTRELTPEQLSQLAPEKYPVTLYIFRKDMRLQSLLFDQLISQGGFRADARLARALAEEYYGEDEADRTDISDLLNAYGISVYGYAEKDPVLTAQLLAALNGSFDFSDMSGYFESILSDPSSTSEEVAAAYLGLAVRKKPVLADIRYLIEDSESFTLRDRLIFTSALAVLGDDDGARESFDTLTKGLIAEERGTDGRVQYRISVRGLTEEENLQLTAAASMAATLLNDSRADGFAEYLADCGERADITAGAKLCYLARLPQSELSAKIRYTLNGETVTEELKGAKGMRVLRLSREQLAGLKLRCDSGEISLLASYLGGAEDAKKQSGGRLTVTKNWADGRREFFVGERVAAEINVSGASGMVTVTDVVPSGMRFCSLDFDSEWNGWSVLHVEGQRVTFVWYPDELGSEPTPLVYTAACVDQGGYISEQTFARCEGEGTLGGSWGMSERSDVSISR